MIEAAEEVVWAAYFNREDFALDNLLAAIPQIYIAMERARLGLVPPVLSDSEAADGQCERSLIGTESS
jgi:hypothetical protein